jgi:hypothetical protein
MELLLSAVSAGGLVGAANQYMCLLLISVAAKLGWISLTPQVGFVDAWWFIAVVAVFWILTVLPAYSTLLSPGVMNAVNTAVNILSGFVVPASATLLTLVSIGVISTEHPELLDLLRTLRIFDPDAERIGTAGWLIAGGSAVTAATLTGAKFLAKPAVSAATGTTGTAAAPIYATIENLGSLVLLGLGYVLMKIDPWLLVGLTAVVALSILAVLVWAIYQLWRLGRGIGRVIGLIEVHPKAGLAVVAEFLVWGLGWLIWGRGSRGVVRLLLWLVWLGVAVFGIPALGAALAAALVAAPFLEFVPVLFVVGAESVLAMMGLHIGLRTARSLLRTFDTRDADHPRTGREASRTPA